MGVARPDHHICISTTINTIASVITTMTTSPTNTQCGKLTTKKVADLISRDAGDRSRLEFCGLGTYGLGLEGSVLAVFKTDQ